MNLLRVSVTCVVSVFMCVQERLGGPWKGRYRLKGGVAGSPRGAIREPCSGGLAALGAIAHHGHARTAEEAGARGIAGGDGAPALGKAAALDCGNGMIRRRGADERRFSEFPGATVQRTDQSVTIGRLGRIGKIAGRVRCVFAGERGEEGCRKE